MEIEEKKQYTLSEPLTDKAETDILEKSKTHIFDNPQNVKRLLMIFFSSVVLLFTLDFFVHKHGHFQWENWTGFYAVFGFAACVLLVLVSRFILRPLVKRKENYYD